MLTRTPEQIALAETSRLCQEMIDMCRDAAEQTSEPRLQQVLVKLIEDHGRLQAAVDERLAALDDLPLSPDPEWEGLKKLATRTKKIFAADESAVLIDERIDDEKQLLSHVADALKGALSADTRACLQIVQRTAEAALCLLLQARETLAS